MNETAFERLLNQAFEAAKETELTDREIEALTVSDWTDAEPDWENMRQSVLKKLATLQEITFIAGDGRTRLHRKAGLNSAAQKAYWHKSYLTSRTVSDADKDSFETRELEMLMHVAKDRYKDVMPHVVQFSRLENGTELGHLQLVMPDHGLTLKDWRVLWNATAREAAANPWNSSVFVLATVHALLQALHEMHSRHFLHVDIKADNVCLPIVQSTAGQSALRVANNELTGRLDLSRLTLIDLGFSLRPEPQERKLWGAKYNLAPTGHYIANRFTQAKRAAQGGNLVPLQNLDWRIDFFSLGVMIEPWVQQSIRAHQQGYAPKELGDKNQQAAIDFLTHLPSVFKASDQMSDADAAELPHIEIKQAIDRIINWETYKQRRFTLDLNLLAEHLPATLSNITRWFEPISEVHTTFAKSDQTDKDENFLRIMKLGTAAEKFIQKNFGIQEKGLGKKIHAIDPLQFEANKASFQALLAFNRIRNKVAHDGPTQLDSSIDVDALCGNAEAALSNLTKSLAAADKKTEPSANKTPVKQSKPAAATDVIESAAEQWAAAEAAKIAAAKRLSDARLMLENGKQLSDDLDDLEAIQTFDELITKFGSDKETAMREVVAKAMVFKGIYLRLSNRFDEAVKICDEVIAKFGANKEIVLRTQVSRAMRTKAFSLSAQGQQKSAIEVHDEIIAKFGADASEDMREYVAEAIFSKGTALVRINRYEDAIKSYDEIIAKFGADASETMRDYAARAMSMKGAVLGRINRYEEAKIQAEKQAEARRQSAIERAELLRRQEEELAQRRREREAKAAQEDEDQQKAREALLKQATLQEAALKAEQAQAKAKALEAQKASQIQAAEALRLRQEKLKAEAASQNQTDKEKPKTEATKNDKQESLWSYWPLLLVVLLIVLPLPEAANFVLEMGFYTTQHHAQMLGLGIGISLLFWLGLYWYFETSGSLEVFGSVLWITCFFIVVLGWNLVLKYCTEDFYYWTTARFKEPANVTIQALERKAYKKVEIEFNKKKWAIGEPFQFKVINPINTPGYLTVYVKGTGDSENQLTVLMKNLPLPAKDVGAITLPNAKEALITKGPVGQAKLVAIVTDQPKVWRGEIGQTIVVDRYRTRSELFGLYDCRTARDVEGCNKAPQIDYFSASEVIELEIIEAPAKPAAAAVQPPVAPVVAAVATATQVIEGYEILDDPVLGKGSLARDPKTGLVWQRCSVGQKWDGSTCSGVAKKFTFADAQKLASNGWRVPTVRELASLIYCSSGKTKGRDSPKDSDEPFDKQCESDYERKRPTIRAAAFPQTPDKQYWTSWLYVDNSAFAWIVDFYNGYLYNGGRHHSLYVRLVR
jgi:serine/threonine protein kinase